MSTISSTNTSPNRVPQDTTDLAVSPANTTNTNTESSARHLETEPSPDNGRLPDDSIPLNPMSSPPFFARTPRELEEGPNLDSPKPPTPLPLPRTAHNNNNNDGATLITPLALPIPAARPTTSYRQTGSTEVSSDPIRLDDLSGISPSNDYGDNHPPTPRVSREINSDVMQSGAIYTSARSSSTTSTHSSVVEEYIFWNN